MQERKDSGYDCVAGYKNTANHPTIIRGIVGQLLNYPCLYLGCNIIPDS